MKKIWILTAMQEEGSLIIETLGLKASKKTENISFFENEAIVLAIAGIGKIQASIATTMLYEKYHIQNLINIGIAGSLMGKRAQIGDIFLISEVQQHDMILPFKGTHLDYIKKSVHLPYGNKLKTQNFDFHIFEDALCLTGDIFIEDPSQIQTRRDQSRPTVAEMEAFAVASVAREFWKLNKTVIIKAVSDGANSNSKESHMDNLTFAMHNSIRVLTDVLKNLN